MPDETVNACADHPWAELRKLPTEWKVAGQTYHESLLRSWRVLDRVHEMLRRGDSRETIIEFIGFMQTGPPPAPIDCKLPRFVGVDWARAEPHW